MFKKILASLGKGAAVVDLQLQGNEFEMGETAEGELIVTGGEIEQTINSIQVALFIEIHRKKGTVSRQIASVHVSDSFIIGANEQKVLPFSFELPNNLAVSNKQIAFYFDTQLDIAAGVNKKDVDYIHIYPSQSIANIFSALEALGFYEEENSGRMDTHGQEFALYPTTHFKDDVAEVEIRFAEEEEGIQLWMELDVSHWFGEKEVNREIFLSEETIQNESLLIKTLKKLIQESIESPERYDQKPSYYSASKSSTTANRAFKVTVGGLIAYELMDEIDDLYEEEDEEDEEEYEEEDYESEDSYESDDSSDFSDSDDY
ncbi:sporulation protein [Domibacillus tundrae]|uniref:sporulation protein n=1 Tax=Domibacillus tundrae TaxID=1587527 RepID=UPI000698A298|nr:sporulation protein [Domibacillus tundrae]